MTTRCSFNSINVSIDTERSEMKFLTKQNIINAIKTLIGVLLFIAFLAFWLHASDVEAQVECNKHKSISSTVYDNCMKGA